MASSPTGDVDSEVRWIAAKAAEYGPITIVQPTKLQQIVAARLAETWRTVPHVTHCGLADITDLESAREAWNATQAERLSLVPCVVKAVVTALQACPGFNASLLPDGTLLRKAYFNIGVIVDVGDGLLIPVIKDCDQKSILEIADELASLATRARSKGLPHSEMSGGCFTISSLGGVAGTSFTPIINAPEAAILGISRAYPLELGESTQPRIKLPLALSYDHRINNGMDAGRFIGTISRELECVDWSEAIR